MTNTVETAQTPQETPAAAPAPEHKPRARKSEPKKLDAQGVGMKLVAACAEMPAAIKNAANPFSKSKYADLQSVFNAIKPALAKHGLMMSQPCTTRVADNGALFVQVETVITDGLEEISSGVLEIPVAGNNVAQGIGSAMTYAKRYSATSFLGIASEDDDGNAAGGASICPPELAAKAKAAAAQGIEAYKAFFAALRNEERAVLTRSGLHEQLKKESAHD